MIQFAETGVLKNVKLGLKSIWRDFDEENEFRIADIFHDVAKGQVLETFVDYAKSLFEEEGGLIFICPLKNYILCYIYYFQ